MKFEFGSEELESAVAAAEEMQREAAAYCEWLRSPEGKARLDQELQEARAIAEEFAAQLQTPEAKAEAAMQARELVEMAEKFKQECASGKYSISSAEIGQLWKDGILIKRNVTPQKGGGTDG